MKKIILLLLMVALTGCANQNIGGVLSISEELKAPKEKILDSRDIDVVVCEKENPTNCINNEKLKSYDYISDELEKKDFFFHPNSNYSNTEIIDSNTYKFWFGDKVYKDINKKVYKIKKGATSTIEAFNVQMEISLFDKVLNYFSKDVIATDYQVAKTRSMYTTDGTWLTARNDDVANTLRNTGFNGYYLMAVRSGATYLVERYFTEVDTSAIGSGKQVDSASYNIKSYSVTDTGQDADYGVYSSSHTDSEAAASFGLVGSTLLSNTVVNIGSWGVGIDHEYAFNPAGKDEINMTGTTFFAMREVNYDVTGSTPPDEGYTYASPAGVSWTSNEPYLTVTFSDAPVGGDPCTPTAGQPFFQSQDCYLTTDVYHNDKWIDNGFKLIYQGGKRILE